MSATTENPCRKIGLEKLVINCGVGASGDKLSRAAKVLAELTGQKPVFGVSRLSIRGFGIRRGEQISTYVTVRGQKAEEILHRGLRVVEYEIPASNFSDTGCFGFGIKEHIDLGMAYDPNTGIYGLDFVAILKRPGAHVSRRKHARGRIGNAHRVTRDEAQKWFQEACEGVIIHE